MSLEQTCKMPARVCLRRPRTPAAVAAPGGGCAVLMLLGLLGAGSGTAANTGTDCGCENAGPEKVEAMQLGEQVMSVAAAIRDPAAPGALAAITGLGRDSRYYTMTRGWLVQVLQGNQSILDASEPGSRPELERRQEDLRRALRAIDLE